MKRSLPILTCLFALSIPADVNAQTVRAAPKTGFYIAGYGGLHMPSDNDSNIFGFDGVDWDWGSRFGGSLGARVGNLRYEAEVAYRTADGDLEFSSILFNDLDVELSVFQGSINLFYDIGDISLLGLDANPYVGGGLGYANADFDGDVVDDESGFLALGELGATLRLGSSLSIVPAYRYEYVTIEILNDDALTAHNLQIGVRLDF